MRGVAACQQHRKDCGAEASGIHLETAAQWHLGKVSSTPNLFSTVRESM